MSTAQSNLYLIHGFLGQSLDWEPVLKELQASVHFDQVININLFAPESSYDLSSFTHLIQSLPQINPNQKNTLIGYSLGGRIAQHWVANSPKAWSRALFLSSNPGLLKNPSARSLWEQEWSDKFRSLDWSDLISRWNMQSIFSHDTDKARKEIDFDRKKLCLSLKCLSLTEHQFGIEFFTESVDPKLYWFYGGADEKYKDIHHRVEGFGARGEFIELPGLGHRLLSHPKELALALAKALN